MTILTMVVNHDFTLLDNRNNITISNNVMNTVSNRDSNSTCPSEL